MLSRLVEKPSGASVRSVMDLSPNVTCCRVGARASCAQICSSSITIGASSAVLTGQAFNLRRARDIAGKYTAAEAGLAVIGGGKSVRLRNENGVLLVLQGSQVGVELSLDLSGMEVAIAR